MKNTRTAIRFSTCPTGCVNARSARMMGYGYVIPALEKKIFGKNTEKSSNK